MLIIQCSCCVDFSAHKKREKTDPVMSTCLFLKMCICLLMQMSLQYEIGSFAHMHWIDWLVGFYGIHVYQPHMGYFMPNPVYVYIYQIYMNCE